LYQELFGPFEACVLDNSPESQILVLRLYTNVLQRWTVILKAADAIPPEAADSVAKLVSHMNKLALTVLQTSPTVSAYSAIIDFYEQTAIIISDPTLKQYVRITIPIAQLVYILFFSHSLAVVARLCNVLACYKRGFETAMTTRPSKDHQGPTVDSTTYARDYVNVFNGFLMDICNCLWRSRAFNRTDTNSLGCYIPQRLLPELTSYVASLDTSITLTSLFGLSHSPTLCLQSIMCVRELEDAEMDEEADAIKVRHAGPVTSASLAKNEKAGGIKMTWQQYRISVLTALEANGLVGIPELMKNTMKILMNSREATTK
jgi:centromere protein I